MEENIMPILLVCNTFCFCDSVKQRKLIESIGHFCFLISEYIMAISIIAKPFEINVTPNNYLIIGFEVLGIICFIIYFINLIVKHFRNINNQSHQNISEIF